MVILSLDHRASPRVTSTDELLEGRSEVLGIRLSQPRLEVRMEQLLRSKREVTQRVATQFPADILDVHQHPVL
jgi:hypothetical protein